MTSIGVLFMECYVANERLKWGLGKYNTIGVGVGVGVEEVKVLYEICSLPQLLRCQIKHRVTFLIYCHIKPHDNQVVYCSSTGVKRDRKVIHLVTFVMVFLQFPLFGVLFLD